MSFPTFKPSPCKRFLVILNWKEQHYSTNSHGVFDAIIDITIAPKNVPGKLFCIEIPQTLLFVASLSLSLTIEKVRNHKSGVDKL